MAYASAPHRPVEIVGHRGSPRETRENTVASFRRAFDAGAAGVELDVHRTADGVVVVHHDPSTNSRPGDSGPVVRIEATTLDELRRVTVAGEPIPTLAEVCAATPASAIVYVEIKASGMEHAVVKAIAEGGRRCAVHSFDHRIVGEVKRLAPSLPVGVLQTSYPIDPLRPMRDAGARDLWQQWELIDRDLIELVHSDGGRVVAWTVNDTSVAARLMEWGIDAICSDVPGAMRSLADARS